MTNRHHPHPTALPLNPLRAARYEALAFAALHRGRIAGYDAAQLCVALDHLERVQDALAAAQRQARFVRDGDERLAEIEALTLFLDRELGELDEARALALLADPALEPHAYFL